MENRMEQLENYKAVILEVRKRSDFEKLSNEDQEYITHMIKKNILASFSLNGNMLNLASKHIPQAKVIAHAVVDQYFRVFSHCVINTDNVDPENSCSAKLRNS